MQVANIDSQGIEVRLRRSVIGFALTLLGYLVLHWQAVSPYFHLLLFLPLFLSASMLYQGLFKT